MPFSASEILVELDKAAEAFEFPGFDNMHYHLVTARLAAYRDSSRWAIVFQEIVWWPAAGGMLLNVFGFGNCLDPRAFKDRPAHGFVDWPVQTMECQMDEEGGLVEGTMRVRGVPVTVTGEGRVSELEPGFDALVHLVEGHREALLATESELRSVLLPPDLPRLLQLETWHHPDVYGEERPSESETFRLLAVSLEQGQAECYQPSVPPNVDWRLWLDR